MSSHRIGVVGGGRHGGAQRGFTLAEVMVAIAVFAVISAIAMTLYSRLQKSFKQGENAATQQQNTRIAFDRMVSDLRMAGFNYNPDGDTGRPDEQIEGMWQYAVTVRGDYDHDTSDANTPESSLGGPGDPFGVVSTGNDEIVTYALRKPNGTGGSTIQFQADVSHVPRDGTLDTVPIDHVYLDMNSPPYTLYRITLKPGGTALSSIADYQPVADNVRSLEFTYYDGAGNVITSYAGGMDDPNSVAARAKIAKIRVKVVGMTQDPDLQYADPTDTNPASRHYRKYELTSDVTPRNLGFVGMPDLDLNDPNAPTGLSVCPGHCQGLWTTWNANDPTEGVVKYGVSYGASTASQSTPQDVYSTSVFLNGLTSGSAYVVGVIAVDASGNESQKTFSPAMTVNDTTRPAIPPSFALSGGGAALPNKISASWLNPGVDDPNTALSCDRVSPTDANTPLRDLRGYRLFRGANSSFDPNNPSQVQTAWDPNSLPGTDPDPNMDDTHVVNCRTYYYKVLAEDECGKRGRIALGSGKASTSVHPASPAGVSATDLGLGLSRLTWNPVTQDVNGDTIFIDTYKVWRASVPTGDDPNLAAYTVIYDGKVATPGTPAYTDANSPAPPAGEDYFYEISARDDCPNESDNSQPALLTQCSFGGTVSLAINPGGFPLSGTQTLTLTVSGTVVPVGGGVIIRNSSTGVTVLSQTSKSYPYTFTWNTGVAPTSTGTYDILGYVTNNAACSSSVTQQVAVSSSVACCLSATTPNITSNTTLGSVSGQKNSQINFQIINNCGTDIQVERLRMDWTDLACPNPSFPQLGLFSLEASDPNQNFILSPVVNPVSGTSPVADFDLRNAPFVRHQMTPGQVSDVVYVFTKAMAFKCNGTPVGNLIASQYDFKAGSFGGGSCRVDVVADPNSTPTLCDPVLDPNCPGF